MMANNVQLRNPYFSGDRMFYFYEGSAKVKGGVISLPVTRPEWVQRAYIMGYRADPETGKVITWNEVVTRLHADSSEEHDEDTDGGRQPDVDNGVREGSEDSSGDTDGSGARGFVRRRSRVSVEEPATDTAGSDEVPS